MEEVIIYHNPRCSKSRATLEILESQNNPVKIVPYLETSFTSQALKVILEALQKKPQEIIRSSEALYQELDLANFKGSDDQLIQIMCDNPRLIERPIVTKGKLAALGRPPESVLDLFK